MARNAAVGRTVVVEKPDGDRLIGVVQERDVIDGRPIYRIGYTNSNGQDDSMTVRLNGLRHLIGGGEMLIITRLEEGKEAQFRQLLAQNLTNWFTTHDPADYPAGTDPEHYIALIKDGRQVRIRTRFEKLTYQVALEVAADELLAAYLYHRISGSWPKQSKR